MKIIESTNIVGNKIYKSVITNFFDFLKKKDIINIGIAFVLATNINNLATSLMDNILTPLINRINGPSETQTIEFEKKTLNILGINFKIGLFITNLLQFIGIFYFIYIVYLFM